MNIDNKSLKSKFSTIEQNLESFLFEAVKVSYLKSRNWKTAFLPFRNSYKIDAIFTKEISKLYGNTVITLDYENKGATSSRTAKSDLTNTDVYDIKSEYELRGFLITNENIDFIIIYGPFDHTCISGPEEFVKSLVSREMMNGYYEDIQTCSSLNNRNLSLRMYAYYKKERLLAYDLK